MPESELEFHPAAREELYEAFDWYERRNPQVADRFAAEIRQVLSRIIRNPFEFPKISEYNRIAYVKGFPYQVVFTELTTTITIISIAHAHRQPEYWIDRLDDLTDN